MDGQQSSSNGETRFVTGGKTTAEQIGEVDLTAISKRALADKRAGKDTAEARTSNGNTFGSNLHHEDDKPPSEKEKQRMRSAQERKAMAALTPANKAILKAARGNLGQNRRQRDRIYASPAHAGVSVPPMAPTDSTPRSGSAGEKTSTCGGGGRRADVCFQLVEKKPCGISQTAINGFESSMSSNPLPRPTASPIDGSLMRHDEASTDIRYLRSEIARSPLRTDSSVRRAVIGGVTTADGELSVSQAVRLGSAEGPTSSASLRLDGNVRRAVIGGVPSAEQGREKASTRKPVHKLRAIAFGDALTPEELKRRQFAALLRKNGYTKAEVEGILESEVARARREDCEDDSDNKFTRSDCTEGAVCGGVRLQTQSAGSVKRNAAPAMSPRIPQPVQQEPTVSRHEAARLRREKLESDARRKKESAISKKAQQVVYTSPDKINGGDDDYESALLALENELNDVSLTSASRHGIMKRIATLKAVHIREKRWREQEKRDSEKYQRRMVHEAEAEKRRQQSQSHHEGAPSGSRTSVPSRVQGQAHHGTNHQYDGEAKMSNTGMVESVLSPRSGSGNATLQRRYDQQVAPDRYQQVQQQYGYRAASNTGEARGRADDELSGYSLLTISQSTVGYQEDLQAVKDRGTLPRNGREKVKDVQCRQAYNGGSLQGGGRGERHVERSDSLDRILHDAGPAVVIQDQHMQPVSVDHRYNYGRHGNHSTQRQPAGYAAAPFANDMNWDHVPH